jgi:serine/threonine protein kinase
MPASATYTFHRCLGRGGFGEVYLATRTGPEGLDRRVAVKVLRSDLPDPELALARLKDEARLLAMLNHPAIVAALELTRLHGRIALVTEYVEGTDLSRFCVAARRLPPRVVVSVVAEIAGALDCAHTTPSPETGKSLRLVHRDVKPENIRLSRHGDAKLLDFGIARSAEVVREARTTSGNMPFTPGYAAPEAFVALRQEGPADLFALGATMYRLLVTERFYEGVRLTEQAGLSSSPERFAVYAEQRLKNLPSLHPGLVPLVRDCLAYDPAARPSAAELQARAEAIADEMAGPTPRKWARDSTFPEERALEGASLLGLTLSEDQPGDSVVFDRTTPRPVVRAPPTASSEDRHTTRPVAVPAPFPWAVLAMGFVSLGIGAMVLAISAFVAGLVLGW